MPRRRRASRRSAPRERCRPASHSPNIGSSSTLASSPGISISGRRAHPAASRSCSRPPAIDCSCTRCSNAARCPCSSGITSPGKSSSSIHPSASVRCHDPCRCTRGQFGDERGHRRLVAKVLEQGLEPVAPFGRLDPHHRRDPPVAMLHDLRRRWELRLGEGALDPGTCPLVPAGPCPRRAQRIRCTAPEAFVDPFRQPGRQLGLDLERRAPSRRPRANRPAPSIQSRAPPARRRRGRRRPPSTTGSDRCRSRRRARRSRATATRCVRSAPTVVSPGSIVSRVVGTLPSPSTMIDLGERPGTTSRTIRRSSSTRQSTGSSSVVGEHGRPALDVGGDCLHLVAGADQRPDHASLVGELLGRAVREHPVEQALGAAHPVGVARRDLACQRGRIVVGLVAETRDEPELVALAGVEHPRRVRELAGDVVAHQPGEHERAGHVGRDAPVQLAHRQLRVGMGDADVGAERQLQAATEGVSVHGGDRPAPAAPATPSRSAERGG